MRKVLKGHTHFVSDVVISSDGQFALSSSWDHTLRLWDLKKGRTTRRFVGHTSDVLSVSFSADNRQIVSASRDKTIKLWNTLGECKYDIKDEGHSEWHVFAALDCSMQRSGSSCFFRISCVRFSPNAMNPVIVSCGWDKVVKVNLLHGILLRISRLNRKPYPLGLGTLKMQAEDQPLWSHWLHQHHLCLARWLFGCFWRKGRRHHAVGLERWQASVLLGSW